MDHQKNFDNKIDILNAIPDDQVEIPRIPIEHMIKEADWLFKRADEDRDALMGRGLDGDLIDDLPIRASVLFQAQVKWRQAKISDQPAGTLWEQMLPKAKKFERLLFRELRYAFRKDDDLLRHLKELSKRRSYAAMIDNLGALPDLGRRHPDLLADANFDMALLDEANQMMDQLRTIWAEATTERMTRKNYRKIRDRAYTYLKQGMDAICNCGKLVFYGDPPRLKGYQSDYLRNKNARRKNPGTENLTTDTAEAAEDTTDIIQ